VSDRLGGRVAVVTGASGALGRAVAQRLAEAGARVALVARTPANLHATELALAEHASAVGSWAADVLAQEELERVREEVVARWGSVDVLVNLAGGNVPAATLDDDDSPLDLDLQAFRDVVELNLLGTVAATVTFGQALAASPADDRAIVNVSSVSATRALTRVGGYGAAKAGVESITRWFAVEFARRGIPIRVNAIAPGFVLGEQNRRLLLDDAGRPRERASRIIERTPMGRLGEPDDIGESVVWLCSPESRFVTGAVVAVDGGFGAFSGV
jgi:NAD(P)-dependent dehydrogenase (short-subunit alcohol dehydrogenase family)